MPVPIQQYVAAVNPATGAVIQSYVALVDSTGTFVVPTQPDGWTPDTVTWTYVSATTFTAPGNLTAQFTPGTRIKLNNTTTKYFVVVSSSFGAGVTTVVVTGGTDYTLANAAITSPYYSYQLSPAGYPGTFAYTPTVGSGTGTITTAVASGRFAINGKNIWVSTTTIITTNGTGATSVTNTLPAGVTANGSNQIGLGHNANTNAILRVVTINASNVLSIFNGDQTYPGADARTLYTTSTFEYT